MTPERQIALAVAIAGQALADELEARPDEAPAEVLAEALLKLLHDGHLEWVIDIALERGRHLLVHRPPPSLPQ